MAADGPGDRDQALRESEEKYRSLFDQSNEGIYLHDLEGRIRDVNQLACAQTGYSRDELIGRTVFDLLAGELDRAEILRQWASWEPGQRVSLEARHRRKDGSEYPVEISTGVISRGGRRLLLATTRDIAARKAAEEALRQREAQLRALGDNLRGGLVYQIDSGLDGSRRRFLYISAGVEQLHGVSAAQVLADAERIYGQLLEEDRRMIAEREARALAAMAPFDAEARIRMPSGQERWRLFSSAPRRLEDGRVVWDGIELDITARRRAEESRERLQAQLSQAQKMESVGRLAGGVAHDFNNMLGVIVGRAEFALASLGPGSPLAADLVEIRRAAERSADLTRQLLAFARKQTIAPVALELNRAVEGALKLLGRLLGEDLELVWAPGEDAGAVLMDPTQLDQVLANLCLNARDAIEGAGQGRIVIRTGRRVLDEAACASLPGAAPGAYAALVVQDTGVGMDEATLARLFEPFFTTKVLGRGTGLGLSTVHGIVTQNHGHIGVTSAPGQGTTFEILLPTAGLAERAAQATAERPAPERGRETILLVEDEPAILRVGQRMLEQLGYAVVGAATPGEALELARRHAGEIHLLMTDVVMPEMNGRDLARSLQSLFPGLHRLFMSGYTADVIAHHGVLDEGVHFLQKPFSREELAARVREALEG